MVKRLLCLVSCMNTGGAETFLMKLYRKMDRSKYQMDFGVYTQDECFYDKEIESLGGKIHHLVPKTRDFSLYKKGLYDLVKKEQYKYVLRITSNAAGFYDLKIAKEAGAKVCIARSSNSSDGESFKVKLINSISRFLYVKYVDVKVAPSDLAAEYTFGKSAITNGEVHYLNNGLDLGVYHFSEEKRKKIQEEFSLQDKFVVGHVGRFSRQKNHEFLLEIFHALKQKRPNAVLLLVGNGELKQNIENKAKALGIDDSIIFAGIRSDVPALLSAMDVFVFPSFYEGMPNTVIEAQATGLPCVIADTITKEAGVTDIVKYRSLKDSADKWVKEILLSANNGIVNRSLYPKKMKDSGYDINDIVKTFKNIVFNKVKLGMHNEY
ncbi:glycosyltransferase family 1 protein [Phascolarctobacterium succinatutens]